jgi:hypothetical protein
MASCDVADVSQSFCVILSAHASTFQKGCSGNWVCETGGGVTSQYLVDTQNPMRYSPVLDELVSWSTVQ